MTGFARFVAIDWSGARGARQAGIQVALAEAGGGDCRLIAAPHGGRWGRSDILDYILRLGERPTLVGIDFAFSVPWDDALVRRHRIGDVRQLWALVETLCQGSEHLYAGPVWAREDSPFRPYIFHHRSGHKGGRYRRNNLRRVDEIEGHAISIYHMSGTQVGAGSFAGMRMLHRLASFHGDSVAIWPFDPVDGSRTTIVEIYPSCLYRKAGVRRPTRSELLASNGAALDRALGFYGGRRARGLVCRSVDQADALVAAAALRDLEAAAFADPVINGFDRREGWIFAVDPNPQGKDDRCAERDFRRDDSVVLR